MNCVKCGRETAEDRVFCDDCLKEMENYPVKPGVAVHIPSRSGEEEPKKSQPKRKLVRTPAEQIARLKKKLLRLRIFVAVLLLIVGGLCFAVSRAVEELDIQRLLGKNYHTQGAVTQTEPTESTEPPIETTLP